MIAFALVLVLIAFLLLLAYFWQKDQRKKMFDDENFVEPEINETEEDNL